MSSLSFLDHQLTLCDQIFDRAVLLGAQLESAISVVLGAAIVAITVPLITMFALDFGAYVSTLAARTLEHNFLAVRRPEIEFFRTSTSIGLVFKMDSLSAIRNLVNSNIRKCGSRSLMRIEVVDSTRQSWPLPCDLSQAVQIWQPNGE
ncbi:hypothetical protein METBIDRAFT_167073 [Metschnikowia bicuspidata var. bicuspidata NRRL YB-4993]|uniref:Uncharacterized protein n=1 Tax=Metschnikowia bicuspidata var. bicuspidata NRRL YB-4993 TaxID=869754 RepID=A0A1A0HAK9_9ASCO|nr:hypothetical protein METBIDRAFT_167073 [Metschnikowia bicuspidata var. bicuspidata NRRL YB-4993]OBA20913.1 hypothetical protein METBIDRAFT_167073 [Metschnikowia bicuspidata var. bicuspidata NRRL YB-4993]